MDNETCIEVVVCAVSFFWKYFIYPLLSEAKINVCWGMVAVNWETIA